MWPYVCGIGILLFLLFVFICIIDSKADERTQK